MKRNINLFRGIEIENGIVKQPGKAFRSFYPLLIAAVVILVPLLVLSIWRITLDARVAGVEAYLKSPSTVQQKAEAIEKKQALKKVQDYIDSVEALSQMLDSQPNYDSKLFDTLYACLPGDARFTKISLNGSSFELTCRTTGRLSGAQYVENLEKSGVLSFVTYSGVTRVDDPSGAVTYEFSAVGTFKPGVEPEAEAEEGGEEQ